MLSLGLFGVLGFVGSGHCVGMCGPFVLGYTRPGESRWFDHVLYGLGRATTYSFMGGLASALGQTLQALLGLRAFLLVTAGLLMVYLALGQLHWLPQRLPSLQRWRWYQQVTQAMFARQTWYRTYPLGLWLGFIPCGLTAIALAFAITQSIPTAVAGMFLFGLGTMPAMVGFGLLVQQFKVPRLEQFTAGLMGILGMLTLWMGLALWGWVPQPPQSALLMRLHPSSPPGLPAAHDPGMPGGHAMPGMSTPAGP
ncbi:MAG: sulfite exporter TauE/SafE family protein [Gloeomargaritaceae cyanobacterium C42_A2020_066]|nr:sulfite exporter TauE/SafE family protein [Gloeomargaritaceae cyanobacterium C42_A2020_066]